MLRAELELRARPMANEPIRFEYSSVSTNRCVPIGKYIVEYSFMAAKMLIIFNFEWYV